MLKSTLAALSFSMFAAAAFGGTSAPAAKQPQQLEPLPEPALISYNNFSLGYLYTSGDAIGLDVDGHGIQAGLEFSPVKHLYLALNGSWSNLEVDLGGLGLGIDNVDFDYWTANAGVGGYIPLTENIHFVTEVGASYASLNLNDFGANIDLGDDWGIYVTPHFRAKWGIFETHVGVTYNSNDIVVSEWTGFARLLFEVAPNVDLFVGGTIAFEEQDGFDDVYGGQAGIRIKF